MQSWSKFHKLEIYKEAVGVSAQDSSLFLNSPLVCTWIWNRFLHFYLYEKEEILCAAVVVSQLLASKCFTSLSQDCTLLCVVRSLLLRLFICCETLRLEVMVARISVALFCTAPIACLMFSPSFHVFILAILCVCVRTCIHVYVCKWRFVYAHEHIFESRAAWWCSG